jgi:hypothetical protein
VQAISKIRISWSLDQVLGAPNCADAFEETISPLVYVSLVYCLYSVYLKFKPQIIKVTITNITKRLDLKGHCHEIVVERRP